MKKTGRFELRDENENVVLSLTETEMVEHINHALEHLIACSAEINTANIKHGKKVLRTPREVGKKILKDSVGSVVDRCFIDLMLNNSSELELDEALDYHYTFEE